MRLPIRLPWVPLLLSGCSTTPPPGSVTPPGSACRVEAARVPLPEQVRETSGLARSRRDPALFWTHNDSGSEPLLYGLDTFGRVVARVRVQGARLVDWEDIEAGPCDAGQCLYIADTGDNGRVRDFITIYRVAEPHAELAVTAPAEALHARFPDGPQDAESVFVLPSGELFLITKGRHGPIALYRYPLPHRTDAVATLERVRELAPRPTDARDWVTSATATPDGQWVGVRTYRALLLFAAADLIDPDNATPPRRFDLSPLGRRQWESLVIANDGRVWTTSEAASVGEHPVWSRLHCPL
jgi:hypothetical protein